jgi:hypothetical protein
MLLQMVEENDTSLMYTFAFLLMKQQKVYLLVYMASSVYLTFYKTENLKKIRHIILHIYGGGMII